MRTLNFILLASACILALAGCRKEMPQMQNPRTDENIYDWSQLFESFWNGMNYNYVFWDIDPTDWDAVYDEYQPKFEELGKFGFMDEEVNNTAADMFYELTKDLVDGHLSITIKIPETDTSYMYSPNEERVSVRPGYTDRSLMINSVIIMLNRLSNAGRFDVKDNGSSRNSLLMRLNDERSCVMASGILDQDIAYMFMSSFKISMHYGIENDPLDAVVRAYHSYLDSWPDLKGVIIDLRGNSGGALSDLPLLMGRLVPEKMLFCYLRDKNGIGRYDYTPWVPEYAEPYGKTRDLDVPVAVLVDMNSVSMAEFTPLLVKELPKGCVIGERTWGGIGTLVSENSAFDQYLGGYFENSRVTAYTTKNVAMDVHGVIHEGKGIEPDIHVATDTDGMAAGNDPQLERAIEFIRNGK